MCCVANKTRGVTDGSVHFYQGGRGGGEKITLLTETWSNVIPKQCKQSSGHIAGSTKYEDYVFKE